MTEPNDDNPTAASSDLLPDKLYYSISEVSEHMGLKPSLLRFWEKEFPQLKVRKSRNGNRQYTPKDVEELKLIYHLVREKKYTLEGARETLKLRRKNVSQEAEMLEYMQHTRDFLVRLRQAVDRLPDS